MAWLLGLWLALTAVAAEVPEPLEADPEVLIGTDAPAPWDAGPELFVPPYALEGVAAYGRYQGMATRAGVPLFLGGLGLVGYGSWWIWGMRNDEPTGVLLMGAGGAVAWAGAGTMTFGSVTALRRLYGDTDAKRRMIPGYIAYGLLGVSGGALAAGAYAAILAPVLVLPFVAIAIPFGVAAGVPAILQVSINPSHRRAWDQARVGLVPMVRRKHSGLALVGRF